jgi:hypothetical protein
MYKRVNFEGAFFWGWLKYSNMTTEVIFYEKVINLWSSVERNVGSNVGPSPAKFTVQQNEFELHLVVCEALK